MKKPRWSRGIAIFMWGMLLGPEPGYPGAGVGGQDHVVAFFAGLYEVVAGWVEEGLSGLVKGSA